MTFNTEIIKLRFANELINCRRRHFKIPPSNEQFARDFFLSSKYKLKVSREGVRKWFKGETFPDLDYLLHLIEWLKLDVSKIFHSPDKDEKYQLSVNVQHLKIEGLYQITTLQIEAFVSLIDEIKKSNILTADNPGKNLRKVSE